ncbi:MAG: primosomal protein, partial [SAR324 cluster bacterium]|nr:primosomal protein [SAR324 cluster bacterium]
SPATSDQAQVEDPSPEKAAESAEKKQTLEELLAVPFNQIKKEQEEEEELALSGDGSVAEKLSGSNKGDVKLPPPPEQRRDERDN